MQLLLTGYRPKGRRSHIACEIHGHMLDSRAMLVVVASYSHLLSIYNCFL